MARRIVIALGGNALMSPHGRQDIHEEISKLSATSEQIAAIARKRGIQLAITHDNGTQVGDELIKNAASSSDVAPLPLALMTAETQASIGSIIETSLNSRPDIGSRKFTTILTHVVVNRSDAAFNRPSKPIGPEFISKQTKNHRNLINYHYSKIGGKYRIVVPSPRPVSIIEEGSINSMLKNGNVICCGGGGIPVTVKNGSYSFEDAVIDKDFTSALLARQIGASMFVILTDVEYVYEDFSRNKIPIRRIRAREIMKRIDAFSEGSIRPKIEACAKFAESGAGIGIIGSLDNLGRIMRLESGTIITK